MVTFTQDHQEETSAIRESHSSVDSGPHITRVLTSTPHQMGWAAHLLTLHLHLHGWLAGTHNLTSTTTRSPCVPELPLTLDTIKNDGISVK